MNQNSPLAPNDLKRFIGDAFDDASKPYTDRDLIELACRAPACPEWFEPDMGDYKPNIPDDLSQSFQDAFYAGNFGDLPKKGEKNFEAYCEWRMKWGQRNAAYQREKLAQWPKAYARMVLESK